MLTLINLKDWCEIIRGLIQCRIIVDDDGAQCERGRRRDELQVEQLVEIMDDSVHRRSYRREWW